MEEAVGANAGVEDPTLVGLNGVTQGVTAGSDPGPWLVVPPRIPTFASASRDWTPAQPKSRASLVMPSCTPSLTRMPSGPVGRMLCEAFHGSPRLPCMGKCLANTPGSGPGTGNGGCSRVGCCGASRGRGGGCGGASRPGWRDLQIDG
eukprot:scaffold121881_cov51-Phaeocystis_antarctica.AAC.3